MFIFCGLGLAVANGFIGFIDDYIKVVKKRNLGLTASQKLILQFLVAAAFLAVLQLQATVQQQLFLLSARLTSDFSIILLPPLQSWVS